jgi:3-deoxy-D-arabino-heptulosonate 7-phosphate (DAHP) synthase
MDTRQVDLVAEHADMPRWARGTCRTSLRRAGRVQRPILLKRGLSATIKEL